MGSGNYLKETAASIKSDAELTKEIKKILDHHCLYVDEDGDIQVNDDSRGEQVFMSFKTDLEKLAPLIEAGGYFEMEDVEGMYRYLFDGETFTYIQPSISWSNEKVEEIQPESELETKPYEVEIKFSAFDIARLGQDQMYAMAEEMVQKVHEAELEITVMTLTPVRIEDDEVVYRCVPTEYSAA